MKTLSLIISILTISLTFAQNTSTTDLNIQDNLVGTWEHVTSTYPNGDIVSFQREFQLFSDGTGVCIDYKTEDTLSVAIYWEVEDNVIVLYIKDHRDNKIETDAQFISLMDKNRMHLAEIEGSDEPGKVCYYRRKTNIVAEY